MVKLSPEQQRQEIDDIHSMVNSLPDLTIVELQSQQIKRLIFFAKKGLQQFITNRKKFQATSYSSSLGEEILPREEKEQKEG